MGINIFKEIHHKLFRQVYYLKRSPKFDIQIFDDFFPGPLSQWRLYEFRELANNFNVQIIPDLLCYKIHYNPSEYKTHVELFLKQVRNNKTSIKLLNKRINTFESKIFYCLFYCNLQRYFPYLERYKIPFVFTLYPGGAYLFNDKTMDDFLIKINKLNFFKGVIVNQNITKKYLIEKKIIDSNKIHLIEGVPFLPEKLNADLSNKKYYKHGKDTFDIAFVALRYTRLGISKGFDLFIELINPLLKEYPFVKFHCVGNYSKEECNYSSVSEKIHFYGYQSPEFFQKFHENMDVIVSPNRPFVLSPGAFDGFPLAASAEAGLYGVVMLLTDYLNENNFLTDGEDFFNINEGIVKAYDIIKMLIEKNELLKTIGYNGYKKLNEHYSYDKQIKPRLELFKSILNND